MITSRAYSDKADLERLIRFLVAERKRDPVQRWHVGDLIWRMFYSSDFDPAQNVRLWEDNGEIVGFGWRYPPNGADLNPRDPALLPEMVAWADANIHEGKLYVATLDANRSEIDYFESHGFQRHPPYGYHLRRLIGDFPAWSLPAGFSLRSLAGDSEVAARAEAHRLAFGTQAVTDEGYRNVIQTPIYDRDLDLLVIAPDRRIAAFCLCWLDEVNHVGLFEPVGTHPDFRRLGLARTVMLEGLRRMQARGMEAVLVATGAENMASQALYQALGFKVQCSELIYVRV